MENLVTFCISTYNNLEYLKIAVGSVRKNSHYQTAPFIIYAENCDDGTDEWLKKNEKEYNLEFYIEKSPPDKVRGIGGGMNFCAERVKTPLIIFLHSDFYVTKDWDLELVKHLNPDKKVWVSPHRVEPKIFPNSTTRPGTFMVDCETFGWNYSTFERDKFDRWAEVVVKENEFTIPKGEGVSGLVRKSDWFEIGGNDPRFAPVSFEDMDLFLRMRMAGFEFILPSKSLVWHFGARGSHRLEENGWKSSKRQTDSEAANLIKWVEKWGGYPTFDEWGMISGIKK